MLTTEELLFSRNIKKEYKVISRILAIPTNLSRQPTKSYISTNNYMPKTNITNKYISSIGSGIFIDIYI